METKQVLNSLDGQYADNKETASVLADPRLNKTHYRILRGMEQLLLL
jgi:hypothetical protein